MDGRTLERRYDEVLREAQYLRDHCHHLELELGACRPALYRADQRIDRLEQRVGKLSAENKILKRKLADLTAKMKAKPRPAPPMFVKPDAISKTRRTPGRKKGHPAALRPMPSIIDVHETVALPIDALGKPCCPECRSQLSDVEAHERYVEELIPSKVVTTCYHTTSGWCPCCRKKVESRAENQPPAADLPHAQLGLNALSTAMVMRVCYRLPFRQITRLFLDLPGLKISPGAIVKQIKRTGKWMEKQYHRLKLVIRAAGVVHADETGWRTNGRNGYLWTLSTAGHTLFHVDRSRSAKVIAELLGKAFGGRGDQTLVSDFYSVYDQFDGPQQKCLTHLLRELRDTVVKRPELTGHAFFVRCKRLIQDMLRLKKRRGKLKAADYWRRVEGVERRLQDLAQRQWNDPDADRLSGRLNKYQAKLTTFLHKKEVDGTNNAAERALRPAVVMRKITGGSRSEEGARAWAIVASVMRTAEQQGKDVLKSIKTLLRAEWAGKESTLLTELLPFDSS
jgi:transposase/polyhydroxyalkanoate synthesis regulator phasin